MPLCCSSRCGAAVADIPANCLQQCLLRKQWQAMKRLSRPLYQSVRSARVQVCGGKAHLAYCSVPTLAHLSAVRLDVALAQHVINHFFKQCHQSGTVKSVIHACVVHDVVAQQSPATRCHATSIPGQRLAQAVTHESAPSRRCSRSGGWSKTARSAPLPQLLQSSQAQARRCQRSQPSLWMVLRQLHPWQ